MLLLSTDRRVLTNIRESKNGHTFKELCDLSGLQAGDITKSLQYLIGKDLISSTERPEGRIFRITEAGVRQLNGGRPDDARELECQYCQKPYSQRGWLNKHEAQCKKRLSSKPETVQTIKISSGLGSEPRAEMPVAPLAQTVRCNGCGSLHKIKRNYGAELLECPLCLKA